MFRVDQHVYPRTVVSVMQKYKDPTNRVGLVQSGVYHYLIEGNLFPSRCKCTNAHLALDNTQLSKVS